mmetsp:Transcript_70537/g.117850  ORF Transcript_70537/g.117850 Transcript_70537/m.117850 type:complete len:90 (-) Transcript_70537:354-623(-)
MRTRLRRILQMTTWQKEERKQLPSKVYTKKAYPRQRTMKRRMQHWKQRKKPWKEWNNAGGRGLACEHSRSDPDPVDRFDRVTSQRRHSY